MNVTIENGAPVIDVEFPATVTITGEPSTGRFASLLLQCEADGTNHRVKVVQKDGAYVLRVEQAAEAGVAAASFDLHCPDDETHHLVMLKKKAGKYVLYVEQDPS